MNQNGFVGNQQQVPCEPCATREASKSTSFWLLHVIPALEDFFATRVFQLAWRSLQIAGQASTGPFDRAVGLDGAKLVSTLRCCPKMTSLKNSSKAISRISRVDFARTAHGPCFPSANAMWEDSFSPLLRRWDARSVKAGHQGRFGCLSTKPTAGQILISPCRAEASRVCEGQTQQQEHRDPHHLLAKLR